MPNPFQPGDSVTFYGRDSGGDTQELSVQQQENAFRTWCAQSELIPGAIFKDVARPGSSVIGRAGFHDLIHHFRSGQAREAGLAIWSYSRFARDFSDSQFYRADLRRRGYIFHSLNDEIPEGSIGKLFEAVIDWKNQTFLEDLSRDTQRGLHDLVRNHGAVPGTPPRGFKREQLIIGKRRDGRDRIAHRWIPDPELTPRVQQAFAMRAARHTLAEIHAETHLYGSINSYGTFFANKIYIGILEFGDQVIENYCESVIDRATWDAVQRMIKIYANRSNLATESGNPNHPRRARSSYLLSGLVYCARCGSPLFGSPAAQRKRKDGSPSTYERYVCAHAYRRRDCDQGAFPQEILDNAALSTLKEYLLMPEVLRAVEGEARNNANQFLDSLELERGEIRGLLIGIRRRISNLTEAIAEAGHTHALIEKLAGLEAEESGISDQLTQIEARASLDAPAWTGDQLMAMLSDVNEIWGSIDRADLQRILRGLVDKIVVNRNENRIEGKITYYLP